MGDDAHPNIPADRQTFLDAIHPADLDGVKQALQNALAGGAAFEIEHRSIGPGGNTRILHSRVDVIFDDQQQPTRVTGTIQDVTERRRLEAQLLGDGVGDNEVRCRFLDAALRGSVRGAELTQRLLAFSRRQTLKPELCDLNDVVRELQGMAGPLGERLATKMVLAGDLWATRIDTGQMENALLNLAINARDAMPAGGSMTIETANVTLDVSAATALDEEASPGDYVAVSGPIPVPAWPMMSHRRFLSRSLRPKKSEKGPAWGSAWCMGLPSNLAATWRWKPHWTLAPLCGSTCRGLYSKRPVSPMPAPETASTAKSHWRARSYQR